MLWPNGDNFEVSWDGPPNFSIETCFVWGPPILGHLSIGAKWRWRRRPSPSLGWSGVVQPFELQSQWWKFAILAMSYSFPSDLVPWYHDYLGCMKHIETWTFLALLVLRNDTDFKSWSFPTLFQRLAADFSNRGCRRIPSRKCGGRQTVQQNRWHFLGSQNPVTLKLT